MASSAAPVSTRPKAFTWRLTEIPKGTTKQQLVHYFEYEDRDRVTVCSLFPDAEGSDDLTATVLYRPHPDRPEDPPRFIYGIPGDVSIDKDFELWTTLYCPPEGTTIAADIIAVTGLAGHAFGSWAHSDEKMWLRDYLPPFAPNARILTYGYDSRIAGPNTSTSRLSDFSNSFSENLIDMRDASNCEQRPIIFIGHSLGCMIIKKTMTRMLRSNPNMNSSRLPVRAIIFFAAPHRGMDTQALQAIAKDSPAQELVAELQPDSEALKQLNEDFFGVAHDIDILTCYETQHTRTMVFNESSKKWARSGSPLMILNASSAMLFWPKEKRVSTIADHSNIAKLRKNKSHFSNVRAAIRRALLPTAQISRGNPEDAQKEISATTAQSEFSSDALRDHDLDTYKEEHRGARLEQDRSAQSVDSQAHQHVNIVRHTAPRMPSSRTPYLSQNEAVQSMPAPFDDHQPRPEPGNAFESPAYDLTQDLVDRDLSLPSASPSTAPSTVFTSLPLRVLPLSSNSRNESQADASLPTSPGVSEILSKNARLSSVNLFTPPESITSGQPSAICSRCDNSIVGQSHRSPECPEMDVCLECMRVNNTPHQQQHTSVASPEEPKGNVLVPLSKNVANFDDANPVKCSKCDGSIISSDIFYQCSTCLRSQPPYRACQDCQKDSKSCLEHAKLVCKRQFVSYGERLSSRSWIDPKPVDEDSLVIKALKEQDMAKLNILAHNRNLINALNVEGYGPLHVAAHLNLAAGAKVLIGHGADLESRDSYGYTPLCEAISSRNEELALELLDQGAKWSCGKRVSDTALHIACKTGSEKIVQALLKLASSQDKADLKFIDATNEVHQTSLYHACSAKEFNIAKLLLAAGANPNAGSGDGEITQLGGLTADNNIEAVRFLLDHGAAVDNQDSLGRTPMYRAVDADHHDLCEFLMEREADPNTATKYNGHTILGQAITNGELRTVELLVMGGAEIECKDDRKRTPLFHAAAMRKSEICLYLLKHGADANPDLASHTIDNMALELTPLHVASCNGDLHAIEVLHEHGAKLEARDGLQRTALLLAAKSGHLKVCEYLLASGADLHAKDKWAGNSLFLAAFCGHPEICEYLITAGANLEVRDDWKSTPLHYAAKNGHLKVCECLIDAGADIGAQKDNGGTPLGVAAENGHPEVCKYLIASGGKLDTQDNFDYTPLMDAARKGHLTACRVLLDSGADPNILRSWNWDAVLHAATMGHLQVVEYLLASGKVSKKSRVFRLARGVHWDSSVDRGRQAEIYQVLKKYKQL